LVEEKLWNTPLDRPSKRKWSAYKIALAKVCSETNTPTAHATYPQRRQTLLMVHGKWKEQT
jgi:hypothetical protein